MKNLIIAAVGDNSCHREWLAKRANFDLALIYYGSDSKKSIDYSLDSTFFLEKKGQKYHLIFYFLQQYKKEIEDKYNYVWLPDDDISIEGEKINLLFYLAFEYKLEICQPAMKGFSSHSFTRPRYFSKLRFTNFVEVIAPVMEFQTFLKLSETFCLNESAWGYEFLWSNKINSKKDKIAIVDSIVMTHTKPIGVDYSRFQLHPRKELEILNEAYSLRLNLENFDKNFKTYNTIYSFAMLNHCVKLYSFFIRTINFIRLLITK